jgi:hypothetical protein
MAQIVEIFEALEKIKDETSRLNISLQSLVHKAAEKRQVPAANENGLMLVALTRRFTTAILVRLAGIEPTTPWFVAKYSIQLSYSRVKRNYSTT